MNATRETMTPECMRGLLCAVIEIAVFDLMHKRVKIRDDARDFFNGQRLDVVCDPLQGITAESIRAEMMRRYNRPNNGDRVSRYSCGPGRHTYPL